MKILIVCNYEGGIRYISNLIKQLKVLDYHVDILDIGQYRFSHVNNINNIDYKRVVPTYFLKIPFIRKFFRIFIMKTFLKNLDTKYDVINLHYATKVHSFFLRDFKNLSNKLVLNMWGSDFFRDRFNKKIELKQLKVYNSVEKILFANEYFQKEFVDYYLKNYQLNYLGKSSVVRWGINMIDTMKNISSREDRNDICRFFNINEDSLVLTVGYNASIYQQHIKIIDSINKIRENFLDKLILMLPMTYREDQKDYIANVISLLDSYSLNYKIFTKPMIDDDVARLRLITDIAINMQTTDDLSGSVQEHLYTGNIVVCGNWLPYKVYFDNGIHLELVSFENLSEKLVDILYNFKCYKNKFNENPSKIYKFSSWEYNLPKWVEAFKGAKNERTH